MLIMSSGAVGAADTAGSVSDRSPWLAASMGRTPAADASAGSELEAEATQVSAGISLVDGEKLILDIGIDYQYTRYRYTGIDSRDRDLHRLQIPVHFERDMGGWQLQGYVAPGVSTSSNVMKDLFREAGNEDLILTGRLLMERIRRNKAWFAGIAHDRRFGRSRAYPVAGLEFEPRDNLHLRLAFPDPSLTVSLSDRQSIQARVYPSGHQWHVVSNDFMSDFDYRVEGWRGQLTWRFPVWRALGVDFSGGYEFGREHHLASDTGTPLVIDVDDQWFFAVSVRLGTAPLPAVHGAGL